MKNLPRGGGGHSHSYSSSSYERIDGDSYYHNKICDSCGERQRENHYYNVTSGNESICGDCGYVYVKQCEHNSLDFYQEVLATCTEPGMRWYYKCHICSKFVDGYNGNEITEVIIAALGHKLEKIEKREPTCIVEGYEEHYKCSNFGCDKFFKDADGKEEADENELRIPILEHNYVNGKCEFCGCPPPLIIDGIGYVYIENGGYYVVSTIADKEATEAVIKSEIFGTPVTGINRCAFYGCSSLTSISIPDSVTSIGERAFENCSNLASITLPDSVVSIEYGAFYGCSSLTSISIPDSVTSIGERAFENCSSLASITLPDSVVSIEYGAFYGCSSLTSVTLPDSVTSIGKRAFENCSSLASITLPDSVVSIEYGAFYGCSSLTSITIPDSVTSIECGAFGNRSGLTEITVPFVGASKDGTNAYFGYIFGAPTYYGNDSYVPQSLKKVTITGGTIKDLAFSGCSGLTSVTISDGVTNIGSQAFQDCTDLTSITVASGNSKYHSDGNCIIETSTKTLILGCKESKIPDDGSVTNIGEYAFYDCNGLTSITIPDSVTSIGSYAFYGCSGLTEITLPFIGASKNGTDKTHFGYIFGVGNSYVPQSLKKVTITGGTCIGSLAFSGCSSLTSITIPDSVTDIGSQAFQDCTDLTSITVASGNSKYHSDGNCIIETSTKTLILGCKESKIPDDGSVTNIGYSAFSGCSSLAGITIPDSVTYIGSCAFYGCSSLTSVALPDSVTDIGEGAFSGCSSLAGITIPDSVTNIGSYAFAGCSGLTSVTIPDSLTYIGICAFSGCSGLTEITVPFVGASKDGTDKTHFGYIFGAPTYYGNDSYVPQSLKKVIITDGSTVTDTAFYGVSDRLVIIIPIDFELLSEPKSSYYYGDTLDLSALKIVGKFSGGYSKSFSYSNSDVSISGLRHGESLVQNGTVSATVSYYGNSKTFEFPITVHAIKELEFSADCKTDYYYGDSSVTLDLEEFGLCAVYDDGTKRILPVNLLSSSPKAGTSLNTGAQTIALHYTCNGKTWDTSIDVTVHSVTSVDFSSNAGSPEPKTEYYCGEYLDLSNFQLYAMYDDGKTVKLTSSDWEAVPANNTRFMNAGNQTVTFSCRLSGRTWTVTKRITVKPARVSSITYNDSWRILFQQAEDWRLNCRGEERFDVTLTDGTETGGSKIGNATLYIGSELLTGAAVNRTITEHTIPADLEEGWYDNCYVMLDGKKSANFKMYVVPSWETISKDNNYSSAYYISMSGTYNVGFSNYGYGGNVKAVELFPTTKIVGTWDFRNCKNLTYIILPSGLESIYSDGFYGCISLAAITIPASVTKIDGDKFSYCRSLSSITVESGNTKYKSMNNCIIDRETKELVAGCKNSDISGFYYDIVSIGDYAFCGCSGLTSITIPDSVTSIGNYAFKDCTGLPNITIPARVRSIGSTTFAGCTNLTSITMRSSAPPNFGSNCFQNVTATMYVPVGSKSNYEQALSASSHKGTITIEER